MYNALNEICSNSIDFGKIVLDHLISSDDVYTILNNPASKEGTQSYTAKTKTMNIAPKENTDDKLMYAINAVAHESFHAYQSYNGRAIKNIYSEVEAYIYSYKVMLNFPHPNYRVFDSKNNNITYIKALQSLLDGNYWNQSNFNYVVELFLDEAILENPNAYKNYNKTHRFQNSLLEPFYTYHK